MARLFTAIELEPGVRAEVAEYQALCASRLGDPGLRLVRSSQLHLTLVFLGEVEDSHVPGLRDAMALDLPCAPFTLAFGGWGVFPDRGPARVLWLGVEQGSPDVQALFEAVSTRLESVGAHGERRPFRPHLTLGRWRESSKSPKPELPPTGTVGVQRVTSVTLFHSQLLRGGSTHAPIARAALAGADPAVH
jgi:2'-5' RNA ligase